MRAIISLTISRTFSFSEKTIIKEVKTTHAMVTREACEKILTTKNMGTVSYFSSEEPHFPHRIFIKLEPFGGQ